MISAGFWDLNFGHLLTITVLGLSGVGFVYTVRGRVDALAERMIAVEKNIQQLVEVLVQQGRMEERIRMMDERQLSEGKRVDELSRRMNDMIDRRGH